jgi:hypothetical protein
MPSSRDRPYGEERVELPAGCVRAAMILSRVALPFTALLVLGVVAGHIAAPIGVEFGRFRDPSYKTEPHDWLILAALLAGVGLAIASCWRARRVLVILSILCLAMTSVMALRAWGEIVSRLTACSSVPFVVVSLVAIIASPSRRHGAHARGQGTPCAACGYPLGPSGSVACPECGALAPASDGGTPPPAAP